MITYAQHVCALKWRDLRVYLSSRTSWVTLSESFITSPLPHPLLQLHDPHCPIEELNLDKKRG